MEVNRLPDNFTGTVEYPDGAKYWIRFTGPEIKSEFTYKVNAEESAPADTRTRREDARSFLEIAMNTPGINTQYLLECYADQYDWLDPKLLFPRQGPGGSPENAMLLNDYVRMMGQRGVYTNAMGNGGGMGMGGGPGG